MTGSFAADLDVGMPPPARFAIDIIRRDDTYYRTIHLWANSPDDALARASQWLAREFRGSTFYRPVNARPDMTPS